MLAEEVDLEEAGSIMFDELIAGLPDAGGDDDGIDFQEFFEAGLDALLDIFLMVNSFMRTDILNALQRGRN